MTFIPRGVSATRGTPHNPQTQSGPHGGLGDENKPGELGTVIACQTDRYTYTVRSERGRTLHGVPRKRSSLNDVATLAPGTEVLLNYMYGFPIIDGVLANPAGETTTTTFSVSEQTGYGGEGDNASTNTYGNFRNAGEPRDLIPGDWAEVGKDGNMFAALGGGVNVMKSSTLAQIRTHLLNDLVEIFSRNYRHVSDMGELKIENNDGRINMSFRGGTDQRNETGPDEEKWSIRFDMGAVGDILNLEFTSPTGQTLFKFHVDAAGHCEIFGINGINLASGGADGGSHTEEHGGNSSITIEGNRTVNITGDSSESVSGNLAVQTSGNVTHASGNDYQVQTLRDMAISAGRNAQLSVQGSIDTTNALVFDIENGTWLVDIGSATTALQKPGYHLKTFNGDIELESTTGGTIKLTTLLSNIKTNSQTISLSTSLPDSVILGGSALTSHVTKYEELRSLLMSLFQALDVHTHSIPGTAVAGFIPVVGTTSFPVAPIGAPLVGSLPSLQSLKAGVSS